MSLALIKNYIKSGAYREARKLIDNEDDVYYLMDDEELGEEDKTPLLVMLSLVKDEDNAVILSRLLLEKGYFLDKRDKNGLCALNYAIALNRQKLLNLFLSSFNFELDSLRDCYKNTILHYVFAINNKQVVNKFAEIYSKYYEWDINKFKFIRNRDGLSVKDLYDFKLTKQYIKVKSMTSGKNYRIMSSYRPFRAGERIRTTDVNKSIQLLCLPKSFYLESNPIHICKFINQVFYNNDATTLNSDLKFVENNIKNLNLNVSEHNQFASNTTREFKLNILHQIKTINKPRPILTTTIPTYRNTSVSEIETKNSNIVFYNNDDYIPNKYMYGTIKCNDRLSNLPNLPNSSWKADIGKIFVDYAVSSTSSYRIGSVPAYRYLNSESNLGNSRESFYSNNEISKLNNEHPIIPGQTSVPNTSHSSITQLNELNNNNTTMHSTLHNLNQNIEIKQKYSLKDKSNKALPKIN